MGGPLITRHTKSKKQNSKLSPPPPLSRLLAGISSFSTNLTFFRRISLSLSGNPRISPELSLFSPGFAVNSLSLSLWISPDLAFSRRILVALAENPRISLEIPLFSPGLAVNSHSPAGSRLLSPGTYGSRRNSLAGSISPEVSFLLPEVSFLRYDFNRKFFFHEFS
jgi:hypothetical protein